MKIRASRLPLAMTCPASNHPEAYKLNADSHAARLGTAVHEWLATRIASPAELSALGDEAFEQLVVKYSLDSEESAAGVSVNELRRLCLAAHRLWREVEHWFPSPAVEVSLEKDLDGIELTGHVDCLSYVESTRTIHVNDHKTGFLDSDHGDQIRAYGLMALDRYPDADRVHTCLLRVRDFERDHETYTRAELLAWAERVRARLLVDADVYNPGRHCAFCPRRLTCAAFRDWMAWALSILIGSPVILEDWGTSQEVAQVHAAKSSVDKLIKEATESLRSFVMAKGGRVDCGDGYELVIRSQVSQEITFAESYPLLSKLVPTENLNDVFKVRKGALHSIVKAGAGRGEKGSAVVDLMAQLEQLGALNDITRERMERRKKVLEVGA